MRTGRTLAGAAMLGGVAFLRPGTRTNRVLRHQLAVIGRRLRNLANQAQGLRYRLRGGQPDPEVTGTRLADRVRSTLGPLEKRLDLPRVHVVAEGHIVLLHGGVGAPSDASEIEAAVALVPGVHRVESHLHVGLIRGDTRPSSGRKVHQPSAAYRRLLHAATVNGVDSPLAEATLSAVLAAFAERIPEGERVQVAIHLPADVRVLFTPTQTGVAPVRTMGELIDRVADAVPNIPHRTLAEATEALVRELRALVPEERADIAAVLPPTDLRDPWVNPPPA